MTCVGSGKAFAKEYVAQMAAAVRALELRAHSVGVGQLIYGSRHLFVEGGPTTMGIELVIGPV